MPLSESEIKRIFKKYKKTFEEMEHYDQTREKLWGRKRIYITLNQRVINRLKELKKSSGEPVSRIIEGAVQKL